jgi:hypothetical protein
VSLACASVLSLEWLANALHAFDAG